MNKKKFFIEFILLRLRYNDLNSSAAFSIVFFFLWFIYYWLSLKKFKQSKREEGKPITIWEWEREKYRVVMFRAEG